MALGPNQQAWVEALRSGRIVQARTVLGRTDGSRCCLGVASDICVEAGILPAPTACLNGELQYAGGVSGFAPESVRVFLGLRMRTGGYSKSSLVSDNDDGATFAEIADLIESEPAGLFTEAR